MSSSTILQYLKDHGQTLDLEIAAATGISLRTVRAALSELSANGEIMKCAVTRYTGGKPAQGVAARVLGAGPVTGPGRKPGS